MNASYTHLNILGLSGSIRSGSTNTAVLKTVGARLGDNVRLSIFPLNDIPSYDSDRDGEHCPSEVTEFKARIAAADGLILCSPEYNHGTSGVLKNALDWASRPAFKSVLRDKSVLIMSSSPGILGGVRAHQQLRDTLVSCLSRVVVTPPVVISHVFEKVIDGELKDEPTIEFILQAVRVLEREIQLWRSAEVLA